MRAFVPLVAIFVLLSFVRPSFSQTTDTLILKDAIDEAGIRAQMAAQGYTGQYIDYYLSKRRKSVYIIGQTPAQAAEAKIELQKMQEEIDALDKEYELRQKQLQGNQTKRISELENTVKLLTDDLIQAQKRISELEAAQKKSGP